MDVGDERPWLSKGSDRRVEFGISREERMQPIENTTFDNI